LAADEASLAWVCGASDDGDASCFICSRVFEELERGD
jgi:hypothetical protein